MHKHLSFYGWVFALLIIGILFCLGLIAWMLFTRTPNTTIFSDAQLVKEAIVHAAA